MNNIFRMSVSACERWFSTVRLLMPSSRAISSLFIPDSRVSQCEVYNIVIFLGQVK